MTADRSPTLGEYIADDDPNKFWLLTDGVRQNLLDEAVDALDAARAEADRLRSALQWYADRRTYETASTTGYGGAGGTTIMPPPIDSDRGDRAREAVAEGGQS